MSTQESSDFGTTDMGVRPPTAPAPDASLRLAQTAPEAVRDTRTMTLDGLLTNPDSRLPQIRRIMKQLAADIAAGRQRLLETEDVLTARRHQITAGVTALGSQPALERAAEGTAAKLAADRDKLNEARDLYRRAGGRGTPKSGRRASFVRSIRRYWVIPTTIGLDYWLVYAALVSATGSENFAELVVLAAVSLLVMAAAPHIIGEELHRWSVEGESLNKFRIVGLAAVWLAVYGALVTARVIDAQSNATAASAGSSFSGMGGDTSVTVAQMPVAATIALFAGVMAGASLLTAVVAWRTSAGEEKALVRAMALLEKAELEESDAAAAVHAFHETLSHVDAEIIATTRAHELYIDEVLPAQASERAETYFLEVTRVVDEDLVPALELRDFSVTPGGNTPASLDLGSAAVWSPLALPAVSPRESADARAEGGAL